MNYEGFFIFLIFLNYLWSFQIWSNPYNPVDSFQIWPNLAPVIYALLEGISRAGMRAVSAPLDRMDGSDQISNGDPRDAGSASSLAVHESR